MKQQVRVRVDDELYYALQNFSKRYHVNMAHIVRFATRKYLIEKGELKRND